MRNQSQRRNNKKRDQNLRNKALKRDHHQEDHHQDNQINLALTLPLRGPNLKDLIDLAHKQALKEEANLKNLQDQPQEDQRDQLHKVQEGLPLKAQIDLNQLKAQRVDLHQDNQEDPKDLNLLKVPTVDPHQEVQRDLNQPKALREDHLRDNLEDQKGQHQKVQEEEEAPHHKVDPSHQIIGHNPHRVNHNHHQQLKRIKETKNLLPLTFLDQVLSRQL